MAHFHGLGMLRWKPHHVSTRIFNVWNHRECDSLLTFPFCSVWKRQIRPYITPHPLSPYIATCLSSSLASHGNRTFTISFLGTSSGIPTKQRLTSCTLVRLDDHGYLFDVGEGAQRQMQFTTLKAGVVDKIFITHMHADHILGLIGVLLSMSLSQKAKGLRRTVHIFGPPGLYDFIGINLNLTYSGTENLDMVVHELVGGRAAPGSIHHKTRYRKCLVRKTIPRQYDGTWILVNSPYEPTIRAAEVVHHHVVQTFGFTLQEQEPERTINPEKAIALGLRPGPKYNVLKQGGTVWNDDSSQQIHPDNVLEGKPRKARKLTIVGDNCALSTEMKALAQDSDVMVHEATLTTECMEQGEAETRGHSSAEMAGAVARIVGAKCLVLNHISPKMNTKTEIIEMRNRAKEASGQTCYVVIAHDFLQLLIPPNGFDPIPEMDNTTPMMNPESIVMNADLPMMNPESLMMNEESPMMNAESLVMNADLPMMNAESPMMNAESPMMNPESLMMNEESPMMHADPLVNPELS